MTRDPKCKLYNFVNEDAVREVGRQLLLDAAMDQMCKYDLQSFLSSQSLSTVHLSLSTKQEMARRLYFAEEAGSPLRVRMTDEQEFRMLPDVIWDMRSGMHSATVEDIRECADAANDHEESSIMFELLPFAGKGSRYLPY